MVGPSFSGKSMIRNLIFNVLNRLFHKKAGSYFELRMNNISPKSLNMHEMYGYT